MNLILFTPTELEVGLEADDDRITHIRDVLRFGPEDWFDIGIENGPRGKARMRLDADGRAMFEYELGNEPPDLFPLTLIVGMPRPQSARRLLREMTSLGVARIWFAMTDRSEKGYARSKLWTTGEWRRHLRHGAEQAFCTRLPEVRRFESVEAAIDAGLEPDAGRLALDNYESTIRMADWKPRSGRVVLAIGAERGWSAGERDLLRAADFTLADLGDRVLRLETAAIAAVSVILSRHS